MLTNLLVVLLLANNTFSLAPKWMQPSTDERFSIAAPQDKGATAGVEGESDKRAENPTTEVADGKGSVKSNRIETAQAVSPSAAAQEAANKAVVDAATGGDLEPELRTTPLKDTALEAQLTALKGQPENLRVMRARLKGSLCVSCLMHLEKKVREQDGIKYARVIRPAPNGGPVVYEPRYAQIEIIYLMDKLNPKKLKKVIERNDFGIRDEKDAPLTSDYIPIAAPTMPTIKPQ